MSTIHKILMGKGGVGKSFVATLLAEHLRSSGARLYCADTDPTNPTFSRYAAFSAEHINIVTPDMNIDKGNFDGLIEKLLSHDGDSVIDNGASSFLPMMSYMVENRVVNFLESNGKDVLIHAVLVGGIGMDETVRMLGDILNTLPARVVVWENELFGAVEKNGVAFLDSEFYKDAKDRIQGVIRIVSRSEDTYGKDLHKLTSSHLSIGDAIASPDFRIMSKERLKLFRQHISEQLQSAGV